MDNVWIYLKYFVAITGGFMTALLGGWDMVLKALVVLVVLDYVTGVTAAWFEKKLSSEVGAKGIAKKILLFVPVVIGVYMDQATGQQVFRSLAIWFYMANEGLSCLENLGRVGIPFPEAMKKALVQLKDKEESTNA